MTTSELMLAVWKAICMNHRGKMTGMWSLSTSPWCNPYCIARHKKGDSIYAKCFSIRQTSYMKNLAKKLEKNTKLLTENEIKAFPTIPVNIMRLESFGDLQNLTQLKNYFEFTVQNSQTTFALWTKNAFLFPAAREAGLRKPDNMIIIESAPLLNTPIEPSDEWIDKVFIVWDEGHDAEINCGGKKCIECQNCYRKDGPKVINERLK